MIAEICGHHSRRQRVAQKDVGVAAEREHAFLNPRPARIVQSDDRRPHLHRQIHDLHDFRGVGLGERPAEHREVLGKGVDRAAVDAASPGNDAVAGHQLFRHAEVLTTVGDQLVDFFEGVGVEEKIDPLARGELAGRVLTLQSIVAASELGATFEVFEMFEWIH